MTVIIDENVALYDLKNKKRINDVIKRARRIKMVISFLTIKESSVLI